MSNPDCYGPGESVDTHIVWGSTKNDSATSAHPQCPGGLESAQNAKSWMWGSRGVHRHPYCRGLEQKRQSDLRSPSVSKVSRWSWVSSKCPILFPWVQRNPTVLILEGFVTKIFGEDFWKFLFPCLLLYKIWFRALENFISSVFFEDFFGDSADWLAEILS